MIMGREGVGIQMYLKLDGEIKVEVSCFKCFGRWSGEDGKTQFYVGLRVGERLKTWETSECEEGVVWKNDGSWCQMKRRPGVCGCGNIRSCVLQKWSVWRGNTEWLRLTSVVCMLLCFNNGSSRNSKHVSMTVEPQTQICKLYTVMVCMYIRLESENYKKFRYEWYTKKFFMTYSQRTILFFFNVW